MKYIYCIFFIIGFKYCSLLGQVVVYIAVVFSFLNYFSFPIELIFTPPDIFLVVFENQSFLIPSNTSVKCFLIEVFLMVKMNQGIS